MARKSILETSARLIPTFGMDKPWTAPLDPDEEEGLAATAVLSGVTPTNTAISSFVRQISNSQYQQLVAAAQAKGISA